jgi:hypothetical protein
VDTYEKKIFSAIVNIFDKKNNIYEADKKIEYLSIVLQIGIVLKKLKCYQIYLFWLLNLKKFKIELN